METILDRAREAGIAIRRVPCDGHEPLQRIDGPDTSLQRSMCCCKAFLADCKPSVGRAKRTGMRVLLPADA
jgi:hypothetical protein